MTPERFHTIVQAYGADARRWPDAERAAAQAWASAHPADCAAILASARDLDDWLLAGADDAYGLAAAHAAGRGHGRAMAVDDEDAEWARAAAARAGRDLYERIVAGAPAGARGQRLRQRARLWWSTAAFAGVGAAGALTGALAMSLYVLAPQAAVAHEHAAWHEAPWLTTSFGSPIEGGEE